MKPATFAAVNGKSRLPVADTPRNDLLTVPVWDLLPPPVQRRCNTVFEFVSTKAAPLDKNVVRQHAVTVGITRTFRFGFDGFDWGWGLRMKFVTGLLAAVLLLAGMGASHAVVRIADDRKVLERAGRTLLERTRMSAVLITRGSRGMALFERERPTVHIPIFGTDEIADVTGAGDTVIATVTQALAAGADYGI